MELPAYNCVCCPLMVDESLVHLFLHCPFAQSCWNGLGLIIGHNNPFITLEQLKDQLNLPFFMEIIVVMSWRIWMQRNDQIFREIQPSLATCLLHLKKNLLQLFYRQKTYLRDLCPYGQNHFCKFLNFLSFFFCFLIRSVRNFSSYFNPRKKQHVIFALQRRYSGAKQVPRCYY